MKLSSKSRESTNKNLNMNFPSNSNGGVKWFSDGQASLGITTLANRLSTDLILTFSIAIFTFIEANTQLKSFSVPLSEGAFQNEKYILSQA